MQIKAAVRLLRHMDGLPMPRVEVPQSSDGKTVPDEMDRPMVHDLLDWLWQTFGFQVSLNECPMDFHFLTILSCFIKFKFCMSDLGIANFLYF
jgi:hypothetical protein